MLWLEALNFNYF